MSDAVLRANVFPDLRVSRFDNSAVARTHWSLGCGKPSDETQCRITFSRDDCPTYCCSCKRHNSDAHWLLRERLKKKSTLKSECV